MKKLLFAAFAVLFAACSTDATEDVAVEVSETLTVSFEEDSRIQLAEGKTVWTAGDLVSVFSRSDANQKWQFQGNTGDRSGILKRVSTPDATEKLSKIVAVYPYSENYYINPESCNIEAMLPAEQTYLADSYGLDGNIMVSASEFNQLYLRNVCGWLKIQLKGEGQVVERITLKGNNGEQVAGLVYINSSDATAVLASEHSEGGEDGVGGTLVLEDTILTEVTLNCGNGVTLGSETAAFYIALPPQTFEKGFTVVASCVDGSSMTKSTSNSVTISSNTIKPMETVAYQSNIPHDQIWYTATAKVEPNDYFNVAIESNEWDEATCKGVITFVGNVTKIGGSSFYNDSITSVTIPDSVTEIESQAFYACENLSEFNSRFASADKRCLIIDGVLISFAPAGITEYAIPNGVTTISQRTFGQCKNLTNITIPNSVTTIEYDAFRACENLKNITIPNSVTTIGNNAFIQCYSLTNITIPDSVTEIGRNIFWDCSSLHSVYCKPSTPPTGDSSMFSNNATDRKIYVPASDDDSIINAYKAADGWKDYAADIEEYNFTE